MATIPKSSAWLGVFKIFRVVFFLLFFVALLINAISIGIKEKSLIGTVSILGEAWVYPLNSASDTAVQINSEEASGFFDSLYRYFNLYYNLYIIYLWIWILTWLGGRMPWSNTSAWFGNVLFALFVFYFIQIIFSVAFLGGSVDDPFIKTYKLFKGLINLFSNPNFSSDISLATKNECNDSICQI